MNFYSDEATSRTKREGGYAWRIGYALGRSRPMFSKLGVATILLLLFVLYGIITLADEYEKDAQTTMCSFLSGKFCAEEILPNGETLQDCYNRTGLVCRPAR